MASNPIHEERISETYKSLITLSVEGFRYLALINGGAVIALLTFLGKNGHISVGSAKNLYFSLSFFLAGLGACGLAMFLGYSTQLMLLNELQKPDQFKKKKHFCLLRAGAVCYIVSLILFGAGAFYGVSAFNLPNTVRTNGTACGESFSMLP